MEIIPLSISQFSLLHNLCFSNKLCFISRNESWKPRKIFPNPQILLHIVVAGPDPSSSPSSKIKIKITILQVYLNFKRARNVPLSQPPPPHPHPASAKKKKKKKKSMFTVFPATGFGVSMAVFSWEFLFYPTIIFLVFLLHSRSWCEHGCLQLGVSILPDIPVRPLTCKRGDVWSFFK